MQLKSTEVEWFLYKQ